MHFQCAIFLKSCGIYVAFFSSRGDGYIFANENITSSYKFDVSLKLCKNQIITISEIHKGMCTEYKRGKKEAS